MRDDEKDGSAPAARAWLFIPPVLLGVLLTAYAASNRSAPERVEIAEQARPAHVIVLEPTSIRPRALGFGEVEPARTFSVVVQVAGRVDHVSPAFQRGALVEAGEVLVRIAGEDYQLALASAEADILSAEAELAELEASIASTERLAAIRREELRLAETELERQRTLAARGAAAGSAVDAQERAVLSLQASVQELENQLALAPAQTAALESRVAVATAARDGAQLDLARTEIAAPYRGRVSEADVEVSQFVSVGAVLGAVDGVDAVEIDAQFPAAALGAFARLARRAAGDASPTAAVAGPNFDALRARAGVVAVARPPDAGGPIADVYWSADVSRISERVDPETGAIGAIVVISDPLGLDRDDDAGRPRPPLLPGSFLEVELLASPIDGTIVAPRSAIRIGRAYVLDEEDRLRERDVAVLSVVGDLAIVTGGLAAGDRLVVTDPSPAIPGMLVRPVEDAGLAERLRAAAAGDAPASLGE